MLREEFLLSNREIIIQMAKLEKKISRMPYTSLLAIAPANELLKLKKQICNSDWHISIAVLNELIQEEIKHLP